ncbi:recombinase RecT [Kitasatospora sp. NPDC048298]|uniref:recombinase RecT n=1 Tax=Kitasatospora sp. NPDC048298 TaxID=3364049 RepID=UPI00371E569A
MSTEIVRATPVTSNALSLGAMSARDAWLFCESLAKANILPPEYRGNPGSVLWALEYGRALGLDVVTTITTIHVIKGKPTQSADLMLSRARAAGHKVRVRPENERCVVSIWRSDDPDFENRTEWTLDDARKAQLYPGKPDSNWAKYTRSMLRARAISECVRSACPEVLHGAIYTPEELGAYVDQEGNPVDAPVQPLRAVPAEPVRDWLSEAEAAEDTAALRALWVEARNSGVVKDVLNQIAQIGREKAPTPVAAAEPVDAEVIEDDERTAAVDALRGAALAAGVASSIEQDFAQSYGVPIADASVEQLTQMTELLAGAA